MTDAERQSQQNGIWLCATCATEIDKDPERFPVLLLRQWKTVAEDEASRLLENSSFRRLGISRPVFAPPIEYQRQALDQVITHLRASGLKNTAVTQLDQVLRSHSLRDGINPIFEPLTAEAVVDAINEMLASGKLSIEDQRILFA